MVVKRSFEGISLHLLQSFLKLFILCNYSVTKMSVWTTKIIKLTFCHNIAFFILLKMNDATDFMHIEHN